MINFLSKKDILAPNIIIVDGYSASGKGMLCKYIQSFNHVQKMCVDHTFHEIAFLSENGFLDADISEYLFKIRLNESYENNLLSRNLNFRPYDDSSVFQSSDPIKYILRLFKKDGANVYKLANSKDHFLLMSHFSMPFLSFFFKTLGDKLKFINIVRHPVYYYKHWIYLFDIISNKNNRSHKFLNEYKNKLFYWFEEPIIAYDMSYNERFISAFLNLNKLSANKKRELNQRQLYQFKSISFENLVMNTNKVERELTKFLSLNSSKNTNKIKRKLSLNQKFFSEREFIRSNRGWKIFNTDETQIEYEKKLLKIKENTSKILFDQFLNECKKYELEYSFKSIKTFL